MIQNMIIVQVQCNKREKKAYETLVSNTKRNHRNAYTYITKKIMDDFDVFTSKPSTTQENVLSEFENTDDKINNQKMILHGLLKM